MSVGPVVGGALGGLLAAWLIPAFGWRSIFIVSGGITSLNAIPCAIHLPELLAFLIRKARWQEALVDFTLGEVAIARIDSLELATVNGD